MLNNLLFIFMVGSVFGYLLELFYRKIKRNIWIKPGVFKGIYLPLYGIGLCIIYVMYNSYISIILKVAISIALLTFIEYLCGVIFIKYFKIPLWDYSNNFLNYKGLVCLKFSFVWGFISFIFMGFVFPYINIGLIVGYFRLIMIVFYIILILDVTITLYRLINKKN